MTTRMVGLHGMTSQERPEQLEDGEDDSPDGGAGMTSQKRPEHFNYRV